MLTCLQMTADASGLEASSFQRLESIHGCMYVHYIPKNAVATIFEVSISKVSLYLAAIIMPCRNHHMYSKVLLLFASYRYIEEGRLEYSSDICVATISSEVLETQ